MKTSRRTIAAVTILLASLSIAARWAESQAQTVPIASPRGVAASLLPLIDDQTIAGAVTVVATPDRVISSETVGYADVAAKRAMRTDDLFWIASMSKSMTATALLMLVDEGKVNVDDPVEKYLPEFQGQMLAVKQDQEKPVLKKPAHPIKVREILSHTSGLPPKTEVEQPTLDTLPLRDAVLSYARTALQFEPGSRYQYSNAGINTAGRIIEVVSGMPYEEFMDRRLFDPLGMKDTTFWPDAAQLERLARSYLPAKGKAGLEETPIGQLRYPLSDRTRYPMPAGGLFSTAADVTRFCQMILSGGVWNGTRYLSEDAVRQMTSSQIGDVVIKGNPGIGYGFGWQVTRKSAGPPDAFSAGTFGHGGAYKTDMKIDPRQKLILVVMMQLAGPQGIGGPLRTALARAANAAFAADTAAAR